MAKESASRFFRNGSRPTSSVAMAVLLQPAFFGLLPRPDEQDGLRGDGLHAVVHHKAHVHNAVGPVVGGDESTLSQY